MTKTIVLSALAAAALAMASPAGAAVITPTSVQASSTIDLYDNYLPEHLIDGSGLTGDLHSSYFGDMWMTELNVDSASLTFDLGGFYDLTSLKVWNYNFGVEEFASTLDRAANAFTMSISTDGVNFTQVLAGNFSRGTGKLLAAETFGVGGLAHFVRLDLSGNHQQYPEYYGYAPVGLSEVRFEGSAVPEPATWAMMIAGFGLVGTAIRRRNGVRALAA